MIMVMLQNGSPGFQVKKLYKQYSCKLILQAKIYLCAYIIHVLQ